MDRISTWRVGIGRCDKSVICLTSSSVQEDGKQTPVRMVRGYEQKQKQKTNDIIISSDAKLNVKFELTNLHISPLLFR